MSGPSFDAGILDERGAGFFWVRIDTRLSKALAFPIERGEEIGDLLNFMSIVGCDDYLLAIQDAPYKTMCVRWSSGKRSTRVPNRLNASISSPDVKNS